jgi:hypothetical protein
MDKWHIGRDGQPRKCDAKVKCRLGADTPHYATFEEASKAAERLASTNADMPSSLTIRSRRAAATAATASEYDPDDCISRGRAIEESWTKTGNPVRDLNEHMESLMKHSGVVAIPRAYGGYAKRLAEVVGVLPASVKRYDDGKPLRVAMVTRRFANATRMKDSVMGEYIHYSNMEPPAAAAVTHIDADEAPDVKVGDIIAEEKLGSYVGTTSVITGITAVMRTSPTELTRVWVGEKPSGRQRGVRFIPRTDAGDIHEGFHMSGHWNLGQGSEHNDRPVYTMIDASNADLIQGHEIVVRKGSSDYVLTHEYAHHIMDSDPAIARAATAAYRRFHDNGKGFPEEYMGTNQGEFFADTTAMAFKAGHLLAGDDGNTPAIRQWAIGLWAAIDARDDD